MNLIPIDLNRTAVEVIEDDFSGLYSGLVSISSIRGGQSAANEALANLDITRYAEDRSEVLPLEKRGASVLSPYIRHNLLTLDQVYRAVKTAAFRDREKFRDELYWQEYARHLYARLGTSVFENLRYDVNWDQPGDGWNREMLCIDTVVTELESDGWLVNQTRMWLASHWTVRNQMGWLHGQERMHRELLDGSRAANLLGWQWTVGAGTGKPYGFARWQVEKRAPGLCFKCPLKKNCPIQDFPDEISPRALEKNPLLDNDPDVARTRGPLSAEIKAEPKFVLLTIDSLGDHDPALVAHPELPVIFIFNKAALAKLQLSARRIAFYIQTLQDLSARRNLHVYLGDPYAFAAENPVAVTFAPVPSFRKFKDLAAIYPYPWLVAPHSSSVRSFSSWRNKLANSKPNH
jgi:deoxyribodipyrimidine photo-lyase